MLQADGRCTLSCTCDLNSLTMTGRCYVQYSGSEVPLLGLTFDISGTYHVANGTNKIPEADLQLVEAKNDIIH